MKRFIVLLMVIHLAVIGCAGITRADSLLSSENKVKLKIWNEVDTVEIELVGFNRKVIKVESIKSDLCFLWNGKTKSVPVRISLNFKDGRYTALRGGDEESWSTHLRKDYPEMSRNQLNLLFDFFVTHGKCELNNGVIKFEADSFHHFDVRCGAMYPNGINASIPIDLF